MVEPEKEHPPTLITLDAERLVFELRQALQETIFSSGRRVTPRRMGQIAGETSASFFKFLEEEDAMTIRTYGQHLAREGFGHATILALAEAIRRVCWEDTGATDLLPISGRYVGALLQGYMEGREAILLQEQERNLRAIQRTQNEHS